MRAPILIACLASVACAPGTPPRSPEASRAVDGPEAAYFVYVAAESADLLHRVRLDRAGAAVEKTVPVGRLPTEMEGPHGISISPDGRYLYLTTGHGVPTGQLWKYELGPDTVVTPEIFLGDFPATVDLTPDGLFAFAVNFKLHGEHTPSSVSVVYTPDMLEVARTETCVMPHGSRINPQGTRHYSACMMDDRVVEIDTRTFEVAREFGVAVGEEGPAPRDAHAGHALGGQGPGRGGMAASTCSPTWVEPSADGSRIFVACNRADRIHEIDVAGWSLVRTFSTGQGPYNLDVTPDGSLLVATLKKQSAVQFFDLETGRSLAVEPSSTTVTHGVVISPDSRYAFVSVEGVGAEPGKLDIYDLRTFRRVAAVDVGQQAGGIAFWKMN